jgi:hypothetical protein
MEVGERIMFPFGGKEKEGVIYKLFENTIYIKADFDKQKGKIIRRKRAQLAEKKAKKK